MSEQQRTLYITRNDDSNEVILSGVIRSKAAAEEFLSVMFDLMIAKQKKSLLIRIEDTGMSKEFADTSFGRMAMFDRGFTDRLSFRCDEESRELIYHAIQHFGPKVGEITIH
jgi:hypothetical protein